MFVQKTTSRRGDKTYVCYLVREGFRTGKGPRSRTVCNVTALPEEAREALGLALKGKRLVAFDELNLGSALDYGGLAVLDDAWKRYALDELFAGVPDPRHRRLLKALIFSRLLFPCSKLALAEQARGTLLAAACGLEQAAEAFDEDDLYTAMDAIGTRWVGLEKTLYRKSFSEPVRLVLYDLTSVYFEGKGPEGLARYGFARDHRSDRRQVLLAVATDREGLPIHIEVLKGNRGDASTLKGLLRTLNRRFGIGDSPGEVVFTFDSGMASRVNLDAIEAEKLSYVTRLSKAKLGALLKQLPEDRQPELFDSTRLVEIEHGGRRHIIAGGEMRRYRDRERREVRLAKAEVAMKELAATKRKKVDLQKLASQAGRLLQRLKAHKYFDYRVDDAGELRFSRKQAVIDAEARLDGWYLLQTNLPADAADKGEVLSHYKGLIEVEAAFRELKSYLEVRPVYHYRVDRVRNHIRICFLAYWLSARLGREFRARGETRRVPILLRELQQIRVGSLRVDGKPLGRLLTQIPPEMNKTLSSMDLLPLFSKPPAWAAL